MIIHFKFFDGSNPYVSLPTTAQGIKRIYKRFNHDGKQWLKSEVSVFDGTFNDTAIFQDTSSGFFALYQKCGFFWEQIGNEYFRFGNAVNAMGRYNAKRQKLQWEE